MCCIELQMVCFIYLWSLDSDAVLAALSLFRCICDEAEIRCALDDMPPDYNVYSELANATNLQTAGSLQLAITAEEWKNDYESMIRNKFIHNCHVLRLFRSSGSAEIHLSSFA